MFHFWYENILVQIVPSLIGILCLLRLLVLFFIYFYFFKILDKLIDIRLKSPGWIKSLEEEMSVERICGSIPMSASSTLLAEDVDMGDDDYDMEGEELSPSFPGPWK